MKNLFDYITEKISGNGTPDRLLVRNDKERVEQILCWDYPRHVGILPFIFIPSKDEILIGNDFETHYEMLKNMSKTQRDKYGLPESVLDMYNQENPKDVPSEYAEINCGRVWNMNDILYMAWWKPLKDNFFEYSDKVFKKVKNNHWKNVEPSYYLVNDNGKLEHITSGKRKNDIVQQSDERKQELKVIKAIHLADQKTKAEFFKAWKAEVGEQKEKELQKLGIRDGTYAKRNQMFSKHIVKDEVTGKHKVVYGAHIGDSLQPNTLLKYINEAVGDPNIVWLGDEYFRGGKLDYTMKNATPFIYRKSDMHIWWGKGGSTHCDIVDTQMKDNTDDDSNLNLGRIWYISKSKQLYIAFWNPIGKDFNKISNNIIGEYKKKFNKTISNVIAINDNGRGIDLGKEDNTEQSEDRKKTLELVKAIHLASQEEKAEYFKAWKAEVAANKEKELQKLGIRDGTYAKRNQMFSKHIVKDEKTGKYKVVYGAHIGDSLSVDNLLNLINEESN